MGRLIDVDELKDVLEYAILANVSTDDANTKEEKWNDWIRSVIDTAPTVEAIPTADYEARLKADLVAMLEEISLEIDEMDCTIDHDFEGYYTGHVDCQKPIREKINSLKEIKDDK